MKVFQTVADFQQYMEAVRAQSAASVGFVPTMGALHAGHYSLVEASKQKSDITVASIFVNPTQFNDKTDFDKYPVTLDADLEGLMQAQCDVVFVPSVEEIYPQGTMTGASIDLGYVGTCLEATHRPGHFEGVVQVVHRLLGIVHPDYLFLGQKDFQQCKVIQQLIQHFALPVEVVICPTMREADGLAMSSRNRRLNAEERRAATKLYQALLQASSITSDITDGLTFIQSVLEQDPLIAVEYLQIVDADTLLPLKAMDTTTNAAVCIAAKVGNIRLIDNVLIS